MAGFWDKIFDFNHDGKLNMFEQATKYATFASIMEDSKAAEDPIGLVSFGESPQESSWSSLDEFQRDELADAGLDELDLEFMEENERNQVLEEAGLDPDEYDFY